MFKIRIKIYSPQSSSVSSATSKVMESPSILVISKSTPQSGHGITSPSIKMGKILITCFFLMSR